MLFEEAYKEMLSGKKIKRPNFKGYWFINSESGKPTVHIVSDKGIKDITYGKLDVTIRNCAAKDWQVVEENKEGEQKC